MGDDKDETKSAITPDPTSTPVPKAGSKTQEMRIAELEASLSAARADGGAEVGDIPAWFRRKFGPSWDTTLAGAATGCVSLVPLLGEIEGCPHWVKIAGGVATAIGIAFMGRQSKSTKVTGVLK